MLTLLSEFPFMDDDDVPHFYRNCSPSEGLYFIADLDEGLIKIGKSKHPSSRLKKFRLSLKKPNLKMMACFPTGVETYAHREFKDLRVKGEWFTPAPRLLKAIFEATQGGNPWASENRFHDYITVRRPKTPISFPWDANLPAA